MSERNLFDAANDGDRVVTMLRGALHRSGDAVDPSDDGLRQIRARIEAPGTRSPRGRRWALPALAAAAGVLVVGGVVGVVMLSADPDPRPVPAAPPTASPAPTAPDPGPTLAPSGRARPIPPGASSLGGVPIYRLSVSGGRGALVREFRSIPVRGDQVTSAVAAMTSQPPLDPDYRQVWSPASSVTVRVSSTGITVDLSADAFGPELDGQLAATAVQQLVWTATAASGKNLPVTVLVDGKRGYSAWGRVRLGEPMSRDVSSRAAVWIDTPQDGTVLPSGRQVVTGQGSGFEATFHWRLSTGDREVDSGFVTGTAAGETYGWWVFRIPLALDPGSYTLTVEADDPSDGEGKGRMWPDTKRFTVR